MRGSADAGGFRPPRLKNHLGDEIIRSHMHDCIEHAETMADSRKNLRSFLTVLERYVV